MKYRRKKLIHLKKKQLKIIIPVLAVIAIVVVIVLVASSQREKTQIQQSLGIVESRGIVNVGLRGDIGALCTYSDELEMFEGLEKDIADEVVARLFADDILVNFVEVSSETKDALLKTGDIDIALGASVAQEIKGINYTTPFYSDGSAFLVNEGAMTREDGLAGKTIAIVQGSYATEEIGEEEEEIMRMEAYLASQNIVADIKVFASYPEAIGALSADIVDGVCANEVFLKVFGKSGMVILPERFMPVALCIGVSGTLGAFSETVDDTIAGMIEDGTVDTLIDKWNLINYDILEEE